MTCLLYPVHLVRGRENAGMNTNNEYPTDEELEQIRTFQVKDIASFHAFMGLIIASWNYADCGYWTQKGDIYEISTGGWSGNEDIIAAMKSNYIFWSMYWYRGQRGGHYIFAPMSLDDPSFSIL